MIDKKSLSERDICSKFIIPIIKKAGWNIQTQVLKEAHLQDLADNGKEILLTSHKRAILFYQQRWHHEIKVVNQMDFTNRFRSCSFEKISG